jgi:predicted  nucleic acid-binding Zn-ribbon protein
MSESKFQSFLNLVALDQKIAALQKTYEQSKSDSVRIEHEKQEIFSQEHLLKNQVHDARKRVDNLEIDMKALDAQETRKKKQMDTVHSLKEYNSVKTELDLIHEEQQAKELDLLSAWNKLEHAETELRVYTEGMPEKVRLCDEAIIVQNANLLTCAQHVKELSAERPLKQALVPEEWFEKYSMMHSRVADPVVPVIDNACSACFNHITQQDALMIRRGALLQCKGCYRLLYTPGQEN